MVVILRFAVTVFVLGCLFGGHLLIARHLRLVCSFCIVGTLFAAN